jgi:2,4-dienoyl-CoA reductase-like NADH-dependent reductase (Old Yellow Enzyme family)/thioredoxin reductase
MMDKQYLNLLSPLKIGNTVLKNRMAVTNSLPLFLQGPEPFPADGVFTHYINKAKNGAAIITCTCGSDVKFAPPTRESTHFVWFDIYDPQCQNYLCQLVDAIHFYGAKASITPFAVGAPGFDVSAGEMLHPFDLEAPPIVNKEISEAQLEAIADDYVKQAVTLRQLGFDIISIHMAYCGPLQARFWSPLTNKRTDKFGGGAENRARFPLMIFKGIREACGPDFLTECLISAAEPEGGATIEDTIEFAKMAEEYVDIIQLRAGDIDSNHPTGFIAEPRPLTKYAKMLKDSGVDMVVATVGGYQDIDASDEVIASGEADLIAMGRCWISNPDYGAKVYEGRNEDVTPCIRCNKCQVERSDAIFHSVCSVNPLIGMEHLSKKLIDSPVLSRKVAVIGGGPAGMKAALVAAERGHNVTLFEKHANLGGQLKHTDEVPFKWPLKNFKDYLIRQIEKSSVDVRPDTEATPKMIRDEGFDTVLAAVGADPMVPNIPGVDGNAVVFAAEALERESSLDEHVAVIGGGDVGAETGLYLAERGHRVTILEMRGMLAADAAPVFYRSVLQDLCAKQSGLDTILNARCVGIYEDGVAYVGADGVERKVTADSVVLAVGTKSKTDDALKFYGSTGRFHMIGDCESSGNVQKSIRSAFAIASSI